jgi:hypothetical protein
MLTVILCGSDTPLSAMQKHIPKPVPLIRDKRKDLPYEFENIIQQTLAKQAKDHYKTASELASNLPQAVEHARTDTKQIKPEPEETSEVDKTT